MIRKLCYHVYMHTQEAKPSKTLSIRLSARTKDELDQLARATRRTKSFLASEAIEAFVARELEIVTGIRRGLADMKAGRIIPHDEAMCEMHDAITKALTESQ